VSDDPNKPVAVLTMRTDPDVLHALHKERAGQRDVNANDDPDLAAAVAGSVRAARGASLAAAGLQAPASGAVPFWP
jgi:hypothetical protein